MEDVSKIQMNKEIRSGRFNTGKISSIFSRGATDTTPKRIFIKTFGCQMNEYDSGVLEDILAKAGYEVCGKEDEAEVVIVNTCSVRQHAEERACGYLREMARVKKERKLEEERDITLVVMGCMAQREGERLFKIIPEVDIICGVDSYKRLPEMLAAVRKNGTKLIDLSREERTGEECENGTRREDGEPAGGECSLPRHSLKGYVAVMRGCNNWCSYCVVPEARGRERSWPISEISDEVKRLVDRGVKEVTLLGQNINAYGKDNGCGKKLVDVLEEVNKIPGLLRIRFITSHPRDAEKELFMAMRALDKVMEHLHLPIQAGSDRILKLMNRGYTLKHYREIIEEFRYILPEGSVGTDIIVGFPGEKEPEFRETLRAVSEIGFDMAYMYKYSSRPGTKAYEFEDKIDEDVVRGRHQELLKLQEGISFRKNEALIGKRVEVLVEGKSKRNPRRLSGRDRGNRICVFEGTDELIGEVVEVKIEKATSLALYGEIEKEL